MDMRKDAGRQMNRSGYQASGECVSGGASVGGRQWGGISGGGVSGGASVEEWGDECGIGKAGLLIGGQF